MSKMDALVKRFPQKGLELERVEIPQIKEGEALVKIKKTAICGTDLHIYMYDEWTANTLKLPMVIGHEFVGEIAEIKGNGGKFKAGDVVCAEGHITCGHCKNCLEGKRHLCPNTTGIGVNRQGIFAEYAAIPLSNLWLTDPEINPELYSIFDPFGNATHTALAYSLVGENVLITGAGSIGIMTAAVCEFAGAKNIVLTDVNPYRLDLAKKVLRRAHVIDTGKERIKDVQKRIGMGEGFDVGLEMSGNGRAFSEMLENMMMGGNIALLGIQNSDAKIDWNKVVFGSLNLKGIYGRKIFETWNKMTAMLKSGLDISSVITHRFGYKDYLKGFELMEKGQCGKVILNWEK